jgi:hypothetical protein
MPILQTPYDHETDDAPIHGLFVEADSIEEAEAQMAEMGYFDLTLLLTDDPRVIA